MMTGLQLITEHLRYLRDIRNYAQLTLTGHERIAKLWLPLAYPPSASLQAAPDTKAPVVVDAELLIELARLTEDQLAEVLAGGIASIQVPEDKPLDADAFDQVAK